VGCALACNAHSLVKHVIYIHMPAKSKSCNICSIVSRPAKPANILHSGACSQLSKTVGHLLRSILTKRQTAIAIGQIGIPMTSKFHGLSCMVSWFPMPIKLPHSVTVQNCGWLSVIFTDTLHQPAEHYNYARRRNSSNPIFAVSSCRKLIPLSNSPWGYRRLSVKFTETSSHIPSQSSGLCTVANQRGTIPTFHPAYSILANFSMQ
jgi:hypothetical protein